ncbi:MAG TPA: ECF-type sigma factor [Burkholderiaceae bacterium]|jgi:RNA polymerase sigma factor (TIGR02999 family)|nr:ECF-type sigma factor [Burkholderiaceae bacterium]
MSDITSLLKAAGAGDRQAADQAFALLYADLQRLAHSRMNRSGNFTMLDTTALVHESWLRFRGAGEAAFADQQHFMGYAARVMHSVVVDFVRARRAQRHGGDIEHVTLNTAIGDSVARHDDEILRVDEAMQQLGEADKRLHDVVELRYFGGLSEAEIAAILGVTERTVQRDWQKARLFLSSALTS